jgi:hypothetical protein
MVDSGGSLRDSTSSGSNRTPSESRSSKGEPGQHSEKNPEPKGATERTKNQPDASNRCERKAKEFAKQAAEDARPELESIKLKAEVAGLVVVGSSVLKTGPAPKTGKVLTLLGMVVKSFELGVDFGSKFTIKQEAENVKNRCLNPPHSTLRVR